MSAMGFAGVDDALELRVGKQPRLDDGLWQMRPIGGFWRRDGSHGGGLHERRRMRLRALDHDRLHRIGLIEPGAERVRPRRFPIPGLVGEFDDLGRRRGRGAGSPTTPALRSWVGRDCSGERERRRQRGELRRRRDRFDGRGGATEDRSVAFALPSATRGARGGTSRCTSASNS